MPGINTLQILIEADATGLTTQLTRAQTAILGFVDKMNEQEVDWTSILSKSIDPAIITGIAAMFADAIVQSVQFQQSQENLGAQLGLTSNALAATGTAAQNTAVNTGESVSNIQQALTALLPVMGGSLPDATQAATDAAKLSQMGFGNMSDIISSVLPVLTEWGATTGQSADQVLQALMNAAQASGVSIPVIAQQFQTFQASALNAGATIANLPDLLTNFGESIAKLGLDNATKQLQLFTTAATNTPQGINLQAILGVSQSQLDAFLKGGAVDQGLDEISKKASTLSQIVAGSMGITPDEQASLRQYSSNFVVIQAQVEQLEASAETIQQAWDKSDNAVRELQKDWQAFSVALTNSAISAAVEGLAIGIGKIFTFISSLSSTELPIFSSLFSSIWTTVKELGGAIEAVWTTLGLPKPMEILDGMVSDFNKMVQIVTILIDGFNTSLALIEVMGTALKDIVTLNWGNIGKDVSASWTSLVDPAVNKTMKDISTFFSSSGIVAGTTAAGAAAPLALLGLGSESLVAGGLAGTGASNAINAALSSSLGNATQSLANSIGGSSMTSNSPSTSNPTMNTTTMNNYFSVASPSGTNALSTATTIGNSLYQQLNGIH